MKIAFFSCVILGGLSLIEAFISLGFNYKKKREVLTVEDNSEASVSELEGTVPNDSLQ